MKIKCKVCETIFEREDKERKGRRLKRKFLPRNRVTCSKKCAKEYQINRYKYR